ncbi:MAG TPA: hypothetical protein VGE31_00590 [Candidatus Paceibacterota bacterium]
MESLERSNTPDRDPEILAERELDELLDHPEHSFLKEHQRNYERIENAETAVEALAIAKELIFERDRRTFEFRALRQVPGVELEDVRVEGIRSTIESIKANQLLIGEGGDAFVVVDRNEIRELPPVICYKFNKAETTPRGRNPMDFEAEIHGEFYDLAREMESSKIAVPMPFYMTAVGADKMIAMEKLPAKSVDDIIHGMGTLPEWLDINEFCDQLELFLIECHKRHLYHRDMHPGNVMVRQGKEEPEDGKWGYVIDFGLSAHGIENMDPYKNEVAGSTFTYREDYAIVEEVRRLLVNYKKQH